MSKRFLSCQSGAAILLLALFPSGSVAQLKGTAAKFSDVVIQGPVIEPERMVIDDNK
ncbi:hypothetical protein LPJGGPFB_05099 [Ensifer adhaerens]|uniref:hypothetical protein n=1 Tax=Ensifer adhaerens TaxID=106592 RepID=UPI0015698502|nr:hypothetical protein [Ensifer adhaerens]NRP21840.1 hypothetical protein [Ensifer adhaerens]